jgi:hypothetical protein
MLGYQKSSAAAPKPHNCFGLKHCQPQSVGEGSGQVTISGTPA